MAHEFESGVFYGQAAWHRLGVTLPEDSDSRYSVEETMNLGKLNWKVTKTPIYLGNGQEVETHKAVIRESDNSVLGVVGNRYECLQNVDQFKWFQPFLDTKECCFETCGSLKEGRVVWVLAKLNKEDSVVVPGTNDKIRKYLVLSTSHDGSLTTRVSLTPIRVVCNNTLTLMINDRGTDTLRVRHTKKQMDALDEIRNIINLTNEKFEATVEQYRKLSKFKINKDDLVRYVHKVLDLEEKMSTRSKNILEEVVNMAITGIGQEHSRGTLWAAYNGVTQYLTHTASRNDDNRLHSAWFGSGLKTNAKALDLALGMVV